MLARLFFGQFDAFDRADRRAADQHLVIVDELTGILKDQVVPVATAAAEKDDSERDHHDSRGPRSRQSGRG